MHKNLSLLVLAMAVCAILPPAVSAADETWGAIRVPGGVAAMRRVAGLGDGPRSRTSAIIDLVRAQYGVTVKGAPDQRERFARYLNYILDVERLLAELPDGLVFSEAVQKDGREQDRFKDILEMFGLRLRSTGAVHNVELNRDDGAVERQRWLRAAGIDVEDAADALNRRERVRPVLQSDEVPLPVPSFWSTVLRKDHEPLVDLVSGAEHLFTYFGLMELDHDTVAWLVANPGFLKRLHDERAVIFGGFGSGIRIQSGAVDVPGGAPAIPVWERLAGAPVTDPARFLANLLERDNGRLAYFYSTVASLDAARQAFLLGQPSVDPRTARARLDYAEAIKNLFASACPSWDPKLQPLFRPAIDPAFVVTMIDVQPSGMVGPDWWPSVFERMAGGDDWPRQPKDTLSRISPQAANAQWLLSFVFDQPLRIEQRWQWVRFAQRQLAGVSAAAAHDGEVVLRAFKDMPALALALERMGLSSPAAFAEVAWAMRRLELATTGDDSGPIVRGWQGALAVLEQVHRHRPVEPDRLAKLLASLARAMPARPMDPSGASGTWFVHELLPAFGAVDPAADDMEAMVLRRVFADAAGSSAFSWEGVSYRVDLRGPVRESVRAIRAIMPGPRLQHLAALDAAARQLQAPTSLSQVGEAAKSLEIALPAMTTDRLGDRITALKRIRVEKDAPKAARERRAILKMMDEVAADVLPSLAYALAMSPTGLAPRTFADSARLHVLFSRADTGRWQSYAWLPGEITNREAGGTAIRGSLLGLDLARSQDLLARAPGVVERPGTAGGSLHEMTQRILVDRAALRARTAWAADAVEVTVGLSRGRARLAALKTEALPLLAFSVELTKAGLGQARQNQLRWALDRRDLADVDVMLSISDLYHLGSAEDLPAGWGQAGTLVDGCWCTRGLARGPIERFRGYSVAYVAVMVADLPLRLAEVLADMRIPADVLEPMLMFAVQDVLDQASQFVADDWEPLTWSGRLTPARVEDYLQALVSRQILAPPGR
jgi:hypothetical protein